MQEAAAALWEMGYVPAVPGREGDDPRQVYLGWSDPARHDTSGKFTVYLEAGTVSFRGKADRPRKGNVDYAAPEQWEGGAAGGRVDQYALACTAFELLSGEPPFRRDEPVALVRAVMNEPPPLLTSRRPDLPPVVNAVVAKALAKRPGDRYATCGEFAHALRKALVR